MSTYGVRHDKVGEISYAALALMEKLGVVAHPDNYAIFYTYLAGDNHDLQQTIDILTSNHREFDELQCQEIYQRFFSDVREKAIVGRITDEIRAQLSEILGSIQKAGIDTRQYGQALDHFCNFISEKDYTDLEQALHTLIGATRDMKGMNKLLETRLDHSSSEISQLREDLEAMRQEAMTDGLTGIANRKAFDQQLREDAMASMESGRPLSLLLIDIDHFKQFNDTHGHLAGDQVIRLMARALSDNVKGRDTAARYGGEEFAIILPQTGLGCARQFAEQLRCRIEHQKVVSKTDHHEIGQVTVSIGVATFRFGEPLARFIERADRALYLAKSNGRNNVMTERTVEQAEQQNPQPDPPSSDGSNQRCA